MRIRTIKPSFFLDSKLLKLPPLARILFAGLWCAADRAGRMEYDPDELRRRVLPDESPKAVDGWLAGLEASGLTLRYSADGKEYLAIPNFSKHQHPNHKEAPSVCPGPALFFTGKDTSRPLSLPGGREGKGREQEGNRKGREQEQEQEGNRTPIPPTGETSLTPVQIPRRSRVAASYSAGFLEAWGAYPHYEQRSSKPESWAVWQKRELEAGTLNVLAWIEAGKVGEDWSRDGRRFVPGMHVWLKKPDFSETPPVQDPYDEMLSLMSDNDRKTMRTLEWARRQDEEPQ